MDRLALDFRKSGVLMKMPPFTWAKSKNVKQKRGK
jgi:hypothetical protein